MPPPAGAPEELIFGLGATFTLVSTVPLAGPSMDMRGWRLAMSSPEPLAPPPDADEELVVAKELLAACGEEVVKRGVCLKQKVLRIPLFRTLRVLVLPSILVCSQRELVNTTFATSKMD